MSQQKKEIRRKFREAVFKRDGFRCRCCPFDDLTQLDAHHITDRNELPNGGYVPENGISLCPVCHRKAERYHDTGQAEIGFHPDELYDLIGSSYRIAKEASERFSG